ncbi:MAG TPA: signal recognition particle-docking protein FtsY [Candidatus Nanoarchaeia archaeon]|nr:signal recognition particle-docking protein FtsY [Candidatus Nanoarchaeia archaeon]
MFGKLKEKLKETLSIFSRKAKEEAEEKVVEKPVVEEKAAERETEIILSKKETIERKEKKKSEKREPKKAPKEKAKEEEKEPKKETAEALRETKAREPEQKEIVKDKKREKEEATTEEEEAISQPAKEGPEIPQKGFFKRFTEKFTTRTISADKFNELFWDLELALLENNVAVAVIERLKADLQAELVDKPLPRNVEEKISETLRNSLQDILSFEAQPLEKLVAQKKPFVIALFGINGSGKTTTAAKLAHRLLQQGFSVVLAACDTFRAAAIQQLEEHAQRLNVNIIKHTYGADAAAVAFDAIKYAEKNKIDVVLIDTAGRLHSNVNLMAELEKIIRVAKPQLKLFVGESITGNDCVEQAQQFHQHLEMDGIILTKADVDEKGGAPLSIAYTVKKPIFFLGVGQRYEDLESFDREKVLQQLGL